MYVSPLLAFDLERLPQIQPSDWSDIRIQARFYLEANYCFPFKFEIQDVLVGTGTAILHENVGWLATIVTHGDYRNQGIGRGITEYLVQFIKSQKCEYIYLIATALGEPVYKKVGFETESLYNLYRNVNLSNLFVSDHIIDYKPNFKQEIYNLDRMVSGENRSLHLESFLEESFVYVENSLVVGVYFPTFGDGLILAYTKNAGMELMKKRFQIHGMASFPQENLQAHNFLESHGYNPSVTLARMYLGKQLPWQGENVYNRVGGKIG
ncbi:MAG: GNAT family N-acetyltransferase [Leadbetterella sp.]